MTSTVKNDVGAVFRLEHTAVPTLYELYVDLGPHVDPQNHVAAPKSDTKSTSPPDDRQLPDASSSETVVSPPPPVEQHRASDAEHQQQISQGKVDDQFGYQFAGQVRIHITAQSNLRHIQLHQLGLTIKQCMWCIDTFDYCEDDKQKGSNSNLAEESLVVPQDRLVPFPITNFDLEASQWRTAEIKYQPESETIRVDLGETISQNRQILLFISYTGPINNELKKTEGLFISDPDDDRRCVATHLEPTNARRLFPCFDEPSFQARFALTVRYPFGYICKSNTFCLFDECEAEAELSSLQQSKTDVEFGRHASSNQVNSQSSNENSQSAGSGAVENTHEHMESSQPHVPSEACATSINNNTGMSLQTEHSPLAGNIQASASMHSNRSYPCDSPCNSADRYAVSPETTFLPNSNSSAYRFAVARFAVTPVISPYLIAFVVGKYHNVEMETRDGKSLRVYLQTSINVNNAWFVLDLLKKAVEFFEDFFGTPLPLKKLDIISISHFGVLAMENWGLITMAKDFVAVRSTTSIDRRQRIARLVGHEVAHHWFGNLVTLNWWNSLWLKEGLARFLEYIFVAHHHPKWDMWTHFIAEIENKSMTADSDSTSPHAVEQGENLHPRRIFEFFDVITYGKAASVLRMVYYLVGETGMSKALKNYIAKHAGTATQSNDLYKCFHEQYVGRQLSVASLTSMASTETLQREETFMMPGSGVSITDLMQAWVSHPNHPYLFVSLVEPSPINVSSSFSTDVKTLTADSTCTSVTDQKNRDDAWRNHGCTAPIKIQCFATPNLAAGMLPLLKKFHPLSASKVGPLGLADTTSDMSSNGGLSEGLGPNPFAGGLGSEVVFSQKGFSKDAATNCMIFDSGLAQSGLQRKILVQSIGKSKPESFVLDLNASFQPLAHTPPIPLHIMDTYKDHDVSRYRTMMLSDKKHTFQRPPQLCGVRSSGDSSESTSPVIGRRHKDPIGGSREGSTHDLLAAENENTEVSSKGDNVDQAGKKKEAQQPPPPRIPTACFVNADLSAVCRVDYSCDLWERILDSFGDLQSVERMCVCVNIFELRTTMIGVISPDDALDRCVFILRLIFELGVTKEQHATVWSYVSNKLINFIGLVKNLMCWNDVRQLILFSHAHKMADISFFGSDATPTEFDASRQITPATKNSMRRCMALCGHPETLKEAENYFNWVMSNLCCSASDVVDAQDRKSDSPINATSTSATNGTTTNTGSEQVTASKAANNPNELKEISSYAEISSNNNENCEKVDNAKIGVSITNNPMGELHLTAPPSCNDLCGDALIRNDNPLHGGDQGKGEEAIGGTSLCPGIALHVPAGYTIPCPEELRERKCDFDTLSLPTTAVAFEVHIGNSSDIRAWWAVMSVIDEIFDSQMRIRATLGEAFETFEIVPHGAVKNFLKDRAATEDLSWIDVLVPAAFASTLPEARNGQILLFQNFSSLTPNVFRILVANHKLFLALYESDFVRQHNDLTQQLTAFAAANSADVFVSQKLTDKGGIPREVAERNSDWADYVDSHYSWYIRRHLQIKLTGEIILTSGGSFGNALGEHISCFTPRPAQVIGGHSQIEMISDKLTCSI